MENTAVSPSLSDGPLTPAAEVRELHGWGRNETMDNHKKFNAEEVTSIIKETIEATITDTVYSHTKVPEWNSAIVDTCLKRLKDMNRNFKYVANHTMFKIQNLPASLKYLTHKHSPVTCVIMQKNGAGFYAGSSVYWDNSHDGSANYRFENKSLYAIVNVFGLGV
ncbi:hypothetical protein INT43_007145 [Umbelopsis isabellina]|uniref:Tctex-1 n=1 Tax=Mortierella isabellina TaxID=91625 RepID=A0A8H7PYN3_MORIS|nr:hypothetical protein INT43_007145 [Umbelopsis isabellina]